MSKTPEAALRAAAAKRILVIDGAMGTLIQGLKLNESISAATASRTGTATSRATTTCSS